MDQTEGRALLEAAGVQLSDGGMAKLVGRRGWPVGCTPLAAWPPQAAAPQSTATLALPETICSSPTTFGSELLASSARTGQFMTPTAVLERMWGPYAQSWTPGVGPGPEPLEGSNLLVVPLDRHPWWYHYHHLFRELLRAELGRPSSAGPQLHVRAAAWCEANGLVELAIDHAQAAGDADLVARLVERRRHGLRRRAPGDRPRGYSGSRSKGRSSATAGRRAGRLPAGAGRSAGRRGALGGRRRARGSATEAAKHEAKLWRPWWPCCRPVPRRRGADAGRRPAPASAWTRETRPEDRPCTSKAPPICWWARPTAPTGSWPRQSRSPPRTAS